MLLVAARREMVERVLAALRAAGLKPEGVDLSAFAMVRALHRAGPDDELVLYLAIGGLTNLAVARGTECTFARASGGGVEALAVELAERSALTLEHAHGWLAHVGVAGAGRGRSRAIARSSSTPARSCSTACAASPPRCAARWTSTACRRTPARVSRAVMTGPASAIPGFDVALASELGMPGRAGRRRRRARRHRRRPRDGRRRPRARGGPGMRAVNLIPAEDRRGLRGGGSGSGVASYIVLGVPRRWWWR